MIRAFGKTDRDFSSNGDIIIKATKAKLHKKDNGDYYIACPDCGMVYLVHTLENGLTKLERTPEDSDSEEIKEQIKEAYDLFAAAGKDVVSCIEGTPYISSIPVEPGMTNVETEKTGSFEYRNDWIG